jgi:hypothetical protein
MPHFECGAFNRSATSPAAGQRGAVLTVRFGRNKGVNARRAGAATGLCDGPTEPLARDPQLLLFRILRLYGLEDQMLPFLFRGGTKVEEVDPVGRFPTQLILPSSATAMK